MKGEATEAGTAGKVVVGLSGGVASAVALALLKTQGYQVQGVHLDLFPRPRVPAFVAEGCACLRITGRAAAEEICRRLGVPFHVVPLGDAFEERVVDAFVHSRLQGEEPAVCFRCDAGLRLQALFMAADQLGAPLAATGHFAVIRKDASSEQVHLHPVSDSETDQSWNLSGLSQMELRRMLTPLGGVPLEMVLKLAREFDLESCLAKPGPTRVGACLMGGSGEVEFLKERTPAALRPGGTVKTADGHTVGEHEGVYRHYVGQRPAIQLMLQDPEAYRVASLDGFLSEVVVDRKENLGRSWFAGKGTRWIQPVDRLRSLSCTVRITPGGAEIPCIVRHFVEGAVHVELQGKSVDVIPGQPAAFLSAGEILGGTIIERVVPQGEERPPVPKG
ncbi:MAG: hypothetical protein IT285_07365 [Bdellovibrionales bacterium]|nr:hypothetical protein [Bdellovibrionales bacterium]